MTDGTPARYKPDHLGRYKVRDAGAGNRFWLSARIGDPCLEVLDADPGDYIIVNESVDPATGEKSLTVRLDPDGGDPE